MRRFLLTAMLALAATAARADIECEYMTFQMSDVDNENHVSLCECGRLVAGERSLGVVAERIQCTSEGWQGTGELCFNERFDDPDSAKRRELAIEALRAYNESFPYCR